MRGLRVLLVDDDPQGAAFLWQAYARAHQRAVPFDLTVSRPKRGAWDLTIYDHAPDLPGHEPLPGELVVFPITPDSVSYSAAHQGRTWCEKTGRKILMVANRWRFDRHDPTAALGRYADILGDAPVIRDRAVFASAYTRGATIYDRAAGLLRYQEAQRELDALVNRILPMFPTQMEIA